jgi:GTPase SAR1 family protein
VIYGEKHSGKSSLAMALIGELNIETEDVQQPLVLRMHGSAEYFPEKIYLFEE